MGFIFYLSSVKGEDIPKIDVPNIDKFFHFVEYFVLGFLLFRAFSHSSANPSYKYIFIAAIFIATIYGWSDEFHQRFVSGRCCDFYDFLTDAIASVVGAALSLYRERVDRAVNKTF